jgi:hypothetical protein
VGKTIVVLLLIAGAAYFIYLRVGGTPSEEEQLVAHLSQRYAAVVSRFTSAAGRSGLTGLDTTGDAEKAVLQLQGLRTDLAELRQRLTEEKAIRLANELSEKIEGFCKKNEILRP